ncbi:MAG: hypothetical protein WAN35_08585 [Terracidiphilus sp.]
MNRSKTICAEAKRGSFDSEIDRLLATEDDLIPSSGFLASIMERVQEEASAPPPIPFPWKRALPGVLLSIGVLVWSLVEMIRLARIAPNPRPLTLPHFSEFYTGSAGQANWIVLSLGLALLSWLFARSLVGRGGLL